MEEAKKLIANLKSFNRKERFHLVAYALNNRTFEINGKFKEKLMKLIPDADFPKKDTDSYDDDFYFASMDYHLDWIYASLCLVCSDTIDPFENKTVNVKKKVKENGKYEEKNVDEYIIKGSIEDVDLIIAIGSKSSPKKVHLIMIEAKGDASWSMGQLNSKVQRLEAFFPEGPNEWEDFVVPHYILMSPENPFKSTRTDFQNKMINQLHWFSINEKGDPFIQLNMNNQIPQKELKKVVRCNKKREKEKKGDYWYVSK